MVPALGGWCDGPGRPNMPRRAASDLRGRCIGGARPSRLHLKTTPAPFLEDLIDPGGGSGPSSRRSNGDGDALGALVVEEARSYVPQKVYMGKPWLRRLYN